MLTLLVLGLALAGVAVRLRPFRVVVSGPSMEPTLLDGDRALALAPGRARRGDVVVLEHPGRPGFEMVKRVTAAEGDLAPDGSLLRPGEIWVEGDRPEASTDSRRFGAVPVGLVRARIALVYLPAGRRRLLRRGAR